MVGEGHEHALFGQARASVRWVQKRAPSCCHLVFRREEELQLQMCLVQIGFVAVLHRSSHNFSLADSTFPAPHIFGIERDAVENDKKMRQVTPNINEL